VVTAGMIEYWWSEYCRVVPGGVNIAGVHIASIYCLVDTDGSTLVK